jgi:hypothetical protein
MTQYSFIAHAPVDLVLSDVGLSFVSGRNVFTMVVKDLVSLLERFDAEGIHVLELHCLEAPATTTADLLLEGESPAVINVHAWRSGSQSDP